MTSYRGTGSAGFTLTALLAALMMGAAAILLPDISHTADTGICLPSPDLWPLADWSSRLINGVAIILLALSSWFLNRNLNIVRHSDFTLPSLSLIFIAAHPLASCSLNASTLLWGVNLLSIAILYPAYRARNAAQEVFATATFFGIGSMMDYSFLVMTPFWILAMGMLKILRLREILAFLMGLAVPYWIGIGFGLIRLQDFHWPQFSTMLTGFLPPSDVATMLVGISLLTLVGALMALNTAIRLYAGNPRPRTYNYIIYLMIPYCAIAMAFDSGHLAAYLATLCFALAVSYSNLFILNNIPRTRLWLSLIYLLMITYWCLIIFA